MFANREDAGRQLATRLTDYARLDPIVVGMARGGVPVAALVAERLEAALDVLVVRKIGVPWRPELGVGAIAEGGVAVFNDGLIAELDLTRSDLASVLRRERHVLRDRVRRYRGVRPPVPVRDRPAIPVDDGLATGFTARAAIEALRHRGACSVVLAVPVAPPEALEMLRTIADEVIAVEAPTWLFAIGNFYEDFSPTSDEEIASLLAAARARLLTRNGRGPEVSNDGGDGDRADPGRGGSGSTQNDRRGDGRGLGNVPVRSSGRRLGAGV